MIFSGRELKSEKVALLNNRDCSPIHLSFIKVLRATPNPVCSESTIHLVLRPEVVRIHFYHFPVLRIPPRLPKHTMKPKQPQRKNWKWKETLEA